MDIVFSQTPSTSGSSFISWKRLAENVLLEAHVLEPNEVVTSLHIDGNGITFNVAFKRIET